MAKTVTALAPYRGSDAWDIIYKRLLGYETEHQVDTPSDVVHLDVATFKQLSDQQKIDLYNKIVTENLGPQYQYKEDK